MQGGVATGSDGLQWPLGVPPIPFAPQQAHGRSSDWRVWLDEDLRCYYAG